MAVDRKQKIASAKNLGPASAKMLEAAGIKTVGELEEIGALAAFCLVKQSTPKASLNLLYALHACLQEKDWRDVTHDEKELLKELLEQSNEA